MKRNTIALFAFASLLTLSATMTTVCMNDQQKKNQATRQELDGKWKALTQKMSQDEEMWDLLEKEVNELEKTSKRDPELKNFLKKLNQDSGNNKK